MRLVSTVPVQVELDAPEFQRGVAAARVAIDTAPVHVDEITMNVGRLVVERWHGTDGQLADHIGLSPDAFSRRMRGVSRWAAHELGALAVLLRVPVGEFYALPVEDVEHAP